MPRQVYGNRWEVVDPRPLGEGGQAQTFLVRDLTGDPEARFALKRLKNVDRIDRFENEIRAIQAVQHPNVLRPVDFSLVVTGRRGKPYLVTEYCSGGSLASNPARWSADPVETLELFAQICDGVSAAHRQPSGPIVHRDIKPENVLLRGPDGPPVIGDFGIAHVVGGERERITATDEAVGARLFIAPELADGRVDQVQPWSDVYSLGKLLFWMLNGGRVFDREQHRDPRWDLMAKFRRNEYEHINRLFDGMITHDPAARTADAGNVAQASRSVADLLRRGARAIGPGLVQVCDFCKQGNYRDTGMKNAVDFHNFVGTQPITGATWRVLVCEQCGHVQWFRIENAKRRHEWWGL
jgi:serine/threonine protein kinase